MLITGADGFVGTALTALLLRLGYDVLAVVRGQSAILAPGAKPIQIGDIRSASWDSMLVGVDAVIHLAARAHVVRERSADPLSEFRAINAQATIDLFRACQAARVERFVFVSSIGVNGRSTDGRAFTETDLPRPAEPYAISKWEAEESLRALLPQGSTNLIVVRPSLIYGPYAKGNFLKIMRWIDAGKPLPFGAIDAKRSLLGLTSFCDLLKRCVEKPFAREQLFLAADDESLSIQEIVHALAAAMNIQTKQWRVPVRLLSILARSLGRGAELRQLSSSLEVDSTRAIKMLEWRPNMTLSEDFQEMVDVYLRTKNDIE